MGRPREAWGGKGGSGGQLTSACRSGPVRCGGGLVQCSARKQPSEGSRAAHEHDSENNAEPGTPHSRECACSHSRRGSAPLCRSPRFGQTRQKNREREPPAHDTGVFIPSQERIRTCVAISSGVRNAVVCNVEKPFDSGRAVRTIAGLAIACAPPQRQPQGAHRRLRQRRG